MPLFGPPNIAKLKSKRDVKGLIQALGYEKDEAIRIAAADALGDIKDIQVIEPLVTALKKGSQTVRKAAARALGHVGDKRAVELLMAYLDDWDHEVREAAVQALVRVGAPATESLISGLGDRRGIVRDAAANALVQIGSPALVPIITLLQDKDKDIRGIASQMLAQIDWQSIEVAGSVVEPLIAVLRSGDQSTRRAAATALGEIGDARAVESLIAALGDRLVCDRAARALGQIGDGRAVEPLVGLFRYPLQVPKEAVDALAAIGDARAVNELAALVNLLGPGTSYNKGCLDIWRAVAEAFARTSAGVSAAEWFTARLQHDDANARATVVGALGAMGDAYAVESLVAMLQDHDPLVRTGVVRALGQIGDARAVEPLIATLQASYDASLDHTTAESLRSTTIEALGAIDDMRVAEPLIAALSDASVSVSKTAAHALVRLYQSGNLDPTTKQTIKQTILREKYRVQRLLSQHHDVEGESHHMDFYDEDCVHGKLEHSDGFHSKHDDYYYGSEEFPL